MGTDGSPTSPRMRPGRRSRGAKHENAALLGKWTNPDEPKLLVKVAMGFLGAPLPPGKLLGPRGCDCSGFVEENLSILHIDLPGRPIGSPVSGCASQGARSEAGISLFFNTRRRLGHVGIYIGNNEFVHAASRKRGCVWTILIRPISTSVSSGPSSQGNR